MSEDKQTEMDLPLVIDSDEKLIAFIVQKLRESWMTPEEKHKEIAHEIVQACSERWQL